MAEGAVRRPSGRLMPFAAHRRSDRSWALRSLSDQSRTEARLAKASMTGSPRVLFGSLSLIVLSSCAGAKVRARPRSRTAARDAARQDLLMARFNHLRTEGSRSVGLAGPAIRSVRTRPG